MTTGFPPTVPNAPAGGVKGGAMLRQIVHVISLPSDEREPKNIKAIVPWLSRRFAAFRNLDNGLI